MVVEHELETGRIFCLKFMGCACIKMPVNKVAPHFVPEGRVYNPALVYFLLGSGELEVLDTLRAVRGFVHTFVTSWVL